MLIELRRDYSAVYTYSSLISQVAHFLHCLTVGMLVLFTHESAIVLTE